jgi:membrane protein DedA with SNARE-associated domain
MLTWSSPASSLALVVAALLAGGLGAPLPEDATLVLAGVLSHRTRMPLPLVMLICSAAVLGADLVLFGLARILGPRLLSWAWTRWVLPKSRQNWVTERMLVHGPIAVFVSRFVPGVRAIVFLLAGLHGMQTRRFLALDAAAVSISVPLMVLLGYFLSNEADLVLTWTHHVELLLLACVATTALIAWVGVARQRRA